MKLTYKKGKGDKIHISVNGEYALTVDETYFYSLSLQNVSEITAEELNNITFMIGERRAYNCAVSLLSRRDHTAGELILKLKQKGYEQYAKAAVEKLIRGGYVDDRRFSEYYVRELINLKGFGKKRIEQELFRKGVSRDIIIEVLEEAEFSEEKLKEIIERKYLRYLGSEKGKQKAVNGLLRLGYSYSEIRDAIREIGEEYILEVCDE